MKVLFFLLLSIQAFAEDPKVKYLQEALTAATEISKEIDRYLDELERSRNAIVWSQGIINIQKTYPFADFLFIENRLRKMGSQTHLIGAPISQAPAGLASRSLYGIPAGNLEFYLWIGVNGPDEASRQLKAFGIESAEKNLQNLRRTGFLIK